MEWKELQRTRKMWMKVYNFKQFLVKNNIETHPINLKLLNLLDKYEQAQTEQDYNELLKLIKQTLKNGN